MSDPGRAADAPLQWAERRGEHKTQRLLRWAGGLIGGGLLVQLVTLYWSHPIAFLIFLGLGVSLVALGVVVFVWFLMRKLAPENN